MCPTVLLTPLGLNTIAFQNSRFLPAVQHGLTYLADKTPLPPSFTLLLAEIPDTPDGKPVVVKRWEKLTEISKALAISIPYADTTSCLIMAQTPARLSPDEIQVIASLDKDRVTHSDRTALLIDPEENEGYGITFAINVRLDTASR